MNSGIRNCTLALTTTMLMLSSASAQVPASKVAKSNGPSNSAIRAAKLTPVHRVKLSNGFRVLLSEAPEEDIVAIELLVQTGVLEEKSTLSGLTRLLSMLLQRRIARDEPGKDRLEDLGISVRSEQELDYCKVSILGRSVHTKLMLDSLSDALDKPITLDELNWARKRFIDNFSDQQGAIGQLYDIFRQSFYRYHPYRGSHRGSELAMERVDLKTAQAFFTQNFAPNKMILSMSGRFEPVTVEEQIKSKYSQRPFVPIKEVDIAWEAQPAEKEVFLSAGAELGWLFVGYPAPSVASRDYASMRLISSALGEGLSSRLFTEIREKRSLCYEINSMYPVLRGPSHFLTYTITKPGNVYAAKKQFLVEIEKLKRDGISQLELDESRRKVIGNFLLERETNQGRAFQLALAEGAGVGYEFEQSFMRDLESITPASLQQVAKRYLDNCTLIIARPPGMYWDL
jgi:zinc protease